MCVLFVCVLIFLILFLCLGPYLQAVVELDMTQYEEYHAVVNNELFFGHYMGINVLRDLYSPPANITEIANVISLTCHLRHRNLQTLFGAFSDGVTYSLLYEVPGRSPLCSLDSITYSSGRLSAGAIILLVRTVLDGLREMHREGAGKPRIIHRDIQCSNILLNQKFGPILCFFKQGIQSAPNVSLPFNGRIGPIGWTAPELLCGNSYNEKVDVFCFASVLYELRDGKFPFSKYHLFDVPKKIMAGDRPKLSTPQSDEDEFLCKVIRRCWSQTAAERPSFEELYCMFDGQCKSSKVVSQAQEELESVYVSALKAPNKMSGAPSRIKSQGAVPSNQVSLAALQVSEDESMSRIHQPENISLFRVQVESTEYYAKVIPFGLIQKRRFSMFQLRVLDVEQLPVAHSKHRGAKHVLRVLYNDVDNFRVRLITHRFDYVLYDRLKAMGHHKKMHWSPKDIQEMAAQIALGMSFLCSCDPPLHHSISTKDIFVVDKEGRPWVMVGGFGLTHLLTAKYKDGILGDRGYVDETLLSSMEHLYNTVTDRNHQMASEKSDVFAFGMVLRTLLSLRKPYEGEPNPNDCVRQGMMVESVSLNSSYRPLIDLSNACIMRNPSSRPTFDEIVQRLEDMKDLSSVADKYKPRFKSKLSFLQPVVQHEDDQGNAAPVAPISLPISKLQPSTKLLLRSTNHRNECGAFMASHGSASSCSLEPDSNFDDYNSVLSKLPHCCFYGVGDGPALIIASKAKGLYDEEPVYRVLIRTQSGDDRCYIPASTKAVIPKKDATSPSAQQLLKAVTMLNPKYEKYNFYVLSPHVSKEESAILSEFESSCVKRSYSIGIVYAKSGQSTLSEMISNETGSTEFESFLTCLGDVIKLNQFSRYAGGLDTKYDSTGKHSLYSRIQDCEVMFHVSTLLPLDVDDSSQRLRMRFLGRNVSLIVFQEEDGALLSGDILSGWPSTQILAVVRPITARSKGSSLESIVKGSTSFSAKPKKKKMYYQVAVASDLSIKQFSPHLENPVFERGHYFRNWLLTKLINGERAAYSSDTKLRVKSEVERAEKLQATELKMQRVKENQ